MFTSRAEFRLLLNHGSAELRLAGHAAKHNLFSSSRLARIREKESRIHHWVDFLESTRSDGVTWASKVRRVGEQADLPPDFLAEGSEIRHEVLYQITYKGYLEREQREVERLRHVEKVRIPPGFDFLRLPGLRKESASKLAALKPLTLGQASRMSGVNPTDISLLMVAIGAGREGERAP
jgi:tRNA uridine 5-carboxymethylaminomethyl modification enzyme